MISHRRPLGMAALVTTCALTIAGCGSSSHSGTTQSSTPTGRSRAQPAAFAVTTTERACLKKHGVTIPSGGRRAAPTGAKTSGAPPTGAKTPGGPIRHRTGSGGAPGVGAIGQSAQQRAADKACGVTSPTSGHSDAAPTASGG